MGTRYNDEEIREYVTIDDFSDMTDKFSNSSDDEHFIMQSRPK